MVMLQKWIHYRDKLCTNHMKVNFVETFGMPDGVYWVLGKCVYVKEHAKYFGDNLLNHK